MVKLNKEGCYVMIYWVAFLTIIFHAQTAVIIASCGKQIVRSGKIAGGEEAYDGEFPSLVSIRLNGKHFCGGTILAQRWIMTAGHCVNRYSAHQLMIRVGEHQLSRVENHATQDIPVKENIVHPNYSIPIRHFNDIALLELADDIKFNDYAWPACLPEDSPGFYKGQEATVTGWGSLDKPGGRRSDILQKVKVPVIDYLQCQNWYRKAQKIVIFQIGQMCAGYEHGGKDACQGDSGGPLFVKDKNKFVVIGVVSAGIGCAQEFLPGLYTEVANYKSWILHYIDNN
ncbi:serine protease 42-like [Tachypleus tridentatus]|uniref:serine protease 42-like n=1 Tax=Tachypleus tridentatus TaxID=6853 RepID=UPI003FD4FD65